MNLRNKHGSTPLNVAAFFCRTRIVKALLDKGADKYLRNNTGHTPWESVAAPFASVKSTYDMLGKALAPLGLKLDYDRIKATRPTIAALLRRRKQERKRLTTHPGPPMTGQYRHLPPRGWTHYWWRNPISK